MRFPAHKAIHLQQYLKQHHEVTDLLITGGSPLVMKTAHLSAYLEPLLAPEFAHVQTLRIGTKALSYWPQRFVLDDLQPALGAPGFFFEREYAAMQANAAQPARAAWRLEPH